MAESAAAGGGAVAVNDEEQLKRGVWPDVSTYGTNKMYYHHTFLPHSKPRTRALAAMAASRSDTDVHDIYTFGVYTGASCKFWHERLPLVGVQYATQWGFDSFEGLPVEAEGMELESKAWLPGAFSAADQFGVSTWLQCQSRLYEHVFGAEDATSELKRAKLQFVKGFFSDSLTPLLASQRAMRPALLLDVDVDLYISAIQVLTWAFESGIAVPGTFVYYDDVGIVKADGGGELRAHEEATLKYGVRWHKYSDELWRIVSIGESEPTAAAVALPQTA